MITIMIAMISIKKVNTSFYLFLYDLNDNYHYTGGKKKNNNNTW